MLTVDHKKAISCNCSKNPRILKQGAISFGNFAQAVSQSRGRFLENMFELENPALQDCFSKAMEIMPQVPENMGLKRTKDFFIGIFKKLKENPQNNLKDAIGDYLNLPHGGMRDCVDTTFEDNFRIIYENRDNHPFLEALFSKVLDSGTYSAAHAGSGTANSINSLQIKNTFIAQARAEGRSAELKVTVRNFENSYKPNLEQIDKQIELTSNEITQLNNHLEQIEGRLDSLAEKQKNHSSSPFIDASIAASKKRKRLTNEIKQLFNKYLPHGWNRVKSLQTQKPLRENFVSDEKFTETLGRWEKQVNEAHLKAEEFRTTKLSEVRIKRRKIKESKRENPDNFLLSKKITQITKALNPEEFNAEELSKLSPEPQLSSSAKQKISLLQLKIKGLEQENARIKPSVYNQDYVKLLSELPESVDRSEYIGREKYYKNEVRRLTIRREKLEAERARAQKFQSNMQEIESFKTEILSLKASAQIPEAQIESKRNILLKQRERVKKYYNSILMQDENKRDTSGKQYLEMLLANLRKKQAQLKPVHERTGSIAELVNQKKVLEEQISNAEQRLVELEKDKNDLIKDIESRKSKIRLVG